MFVIRICVQSDNRIPSSYTFCPPNKNIRVSFFAKACAIAKASSKLEAKIASGCLRKRVSSVRREKDQVHTLYNSYSLI